MSPVRRIATTGVAAAALVMSTSPALAGAPTITTESLSDVTFSARRANLACTALGYQTQDRLFVTFDRTVRTTEFASGRLIEVARIEGIITGTSGATAQFRAVPVFTLRPDDSELEVGLSYKYRISGTTIVISGNGGDARTAHEEFRPLCEALLT